MSFFSLIGKMWNWQNMGDRRDFMFLFGALLLVTLVSICKIIV